MENRDYLMREIERIILFFQNLISGLTVDNFEVEIRKFNSALVSEFDINLDELIEFSNKDFIEKIEHRKLSNVEILTEALTKLIFKLEELEKGGIYNISEISKKAIVLLEYMNFKSRTFSINRENLINVLTEKLKL